MIELRPDLVRADMGLDGLGPALSLAAGLPGPIPLWPWVDGAQLLLRWSGERLPLPDWSDPEARQCEVVGFALAGEEEIDTWTDVEHLADTIYHYAVIQLGGGGVANRVRPFEIVTRTFDAAGDLRGLMPNAPTSLSLRLAAGERPALSWWYSTARQQVAPAVFCVYISAGAAFDFSSPTATVSYTRGQTRYEWAGDALSPGDERWYTVRGRSSAGVLSLIPRAGLCPSGDYGAADLGRCPMVRIPTAAPEAIEALYLEAPR